MIAGHKFGNTLVVIRPEAIERLTDPDAEPVIVADMEGNRAHVAVMLIAAEYLDWNVEFHIGYDGSSDITLALDRGEVDVYGSSRPRCSTTGSRWSPRTHSSPRPPGRRTTWSSACARRTRRSSSTRSSSTRS
jgi:hypothetical protein